MRKIKGICSYLPVQQNFCNKSEPVGTPVKTVIAWQEYT